MTMRAAILTSTDSPPSTGDFDDPVAEDGQAVVAIILAGMNPVDLIKASARMRPVPTPSVAGSKGVARLDGRRVHFRRCGRPVRIDGPAHADRAVGGHRRPRRPRGRHGRHARDRGHGRMAASAPLELTGRPTAAGLAQGDPMIYDTPGCPRWCADRRRRSHPRRSWERRIVVLRRSEHQPGRPRPARSPRSIAAGDIKGGAVVQRGHHVSVGCV